MLTHVLFYLFQRYEYTARGRGFFFSKRVEENVRDAVKKVNRTEEKASQNM